MSCTSKAKKNYRSFVWQFFVSVNGKKIKTFFSVMNSTNVLSLAYTCYYQSFDKIDKTQILTL